FKTKVAPDAEIIKRTYSILVPCIPITFDVSSETNLREVEECNDLLAGMITKARWIKPENRRSREQRAAHAIFTLRDARTANLCIRDGMYISGLKIHPGRLKHKPMQYMKCRHWGHFVHSCMASVDTCGTCGREHRTKNCTCRDKLHCVLCNTNTHASWDRECPEFLRRCAQSNENYPENYLPYFPTGEDWMLMPR
ncbi:hypothetical protein EI94DRAFT_1517802, partial [Lactarius quietus]